MMDESQLRTLVEHALKTTARKDLQGAAKATGVCKANGTNVAARRGKNLATNCPDGRVSTTLPRRASRGQREKPISPASAASVATGL